MVDIWDLTPPTRRFPSECLAAATRVSVRNLANPSNAKPHQFRHTRRARVDSPSSSKSQGSSPSSSSSSSSPSQSESLSRSCAVESAASTSTSDAWRPRWPLLTSLASRARGVLIACTAGGGGGPACGAATVTWEAGARYLAKRLARLEIEPSEQILSKNLRWTYQ